MVLGVAATLAVAGDTLGYDFLAYHAAASRVLDGQPAYDTSFEAAGGFGLFYYPPTFIPLVLPFGAAAGADRDRGRGSALPARRVRRRRRGRCRFAARALAHASCSPALSWPFLYAIKLGQVGPILFLLFAIGWRWVDTRPVVLGRHRRRSARRSSSSPGSSSCGRC